MSFLFQPQPKSESRRQCCRQSLIKSLNSLLIGTYWHYIGLNTSFKVPVAQSHDGFSMTRVIGRHVQHPNLLPNPSRLNPDHAPTTSLL